MVVNSTWRDLSDAQLSQAADRLDDYAPEGQRAILAELETRGLPEPARKPDVPQVPGFLTTPTRTERIWGRVVFVVGVLIVLMCALVYASGANFGILGSLIVGSLTGGSFVASHQLRKGTPLANLEAELKREQVRCRSAAAAALERIEPAGRAAAIAVLEPIAAGDSDAGVREAAAETIRRLEAARAAQATSA